MVPQRGAECFIGSHVVGGGFILLDVYLCGCAVCCVDGEVLCHWSIDQVQQKLEAVNVFTIARRPVDMAGQTQELLYTSLKFTNNIWVLAELKIVPNTTTVSVRPVYCCDT